MPTPSYNDVVLCISFRGQDFGTDARGRVLIQRAERVDRPPPTHFDAAASPVLNRRTIKHDETRSDGRR